MSSPTAADPWLYRVIALAAAGVYPAWGIACQLILPGSANDMGGRLLCGGFLLAVVAASYASRAVAARMEGWITVGCALVVAHYSWLVWLNGATAFWVAGMFVTLGAIDALFTTTRALGAFTVVALLAALPIAFGGGGLDPVGTVLFLGLATQQTLFMISLRARRTLAARLERADASVRALSAGLDATFDGVYLITPADGRIAYANHGAAVQSGRGREALVGRPIGELLPALGGEALGALVAELRAAGPAERLVEATYVRPDGPGPDAEVSLHLLDLPEAGERLVAVARDTTARKRLERELQARNERLTELDRLKTELMGAVSHELRTPLTTIVGYTELLDDDPTLAAAHRGHVAWIREAARRLGRQIDDLLDVARLAAGAFRLDRGRLEVAELLDQVAGELAPRAAAKGVALAVAPPPPLPVVDGDRDRLCQVLENLVGNAIKFTPPGGRVDVAAEATAAGGVRVTVRDTGIGITPEDQARVFEKFFQARPGASRQHGGAGLGLAIAQMLVEAHGGRIGVESAPGAGAAFWFELPAAAPDDGPDGGFGGPAGDRVAA